jgi:hypothetical protein
MDPFPRRSTGFRLILAALLVFLGGSRSFGQSEANITLKPVRYGELVEVVKAQRGKVLVVDVWAEY